MKPLLFTIAAIVVAPLALAGASTQGLPSTQKPPSAASVTADPRAVVASKVPGTSPEDVHATPVPGLFEIMRGTDAAYVTADGKYAIAGDLYDLHTNVDLTENQRRATRVRLLSAIPESQMVIFGPKDARHTVTVFTDVDCAYCRKFHSQIADYNRMGIRVRYVFYPRTGPNTESWTKAEQVWCSANRNDALTRAKLGEALKAKVCPNTPVGREYELGREFDLQGTPAIVLSNGDMLPGYLSPIELAQALRTVQH
ncbi:MAG TPA: DsbC family protein [Steroidobacteraceae bacterium]|nr:DsbC family protein [Steroidobacteraceae bacterium]